MPSWAEFQPYIVTGLALGGLYALSGVGLVVLYRATGVLNLAFGAVGPVLQLCLRGEAYAHLCAGHGQARMRRGVALIQP